MYIYQTNEPLQEYNLKQPYNITKNILKFFMIWLHSWNTQNHGSIDQYTCYVCQNYVFYVSDIVMSCTILGFSV